MAVDTWSLYVHIFPNGKKYYGITSKQPQQRWQKDGRGYKGQVVYNAILKYGWDNIEHTIILSGLTKEDAELQEKQYIMSDNTMLPNGYNVESGGNVNKTISPEYHNKLSQIHKGLNKGKNNVTSKPVYQFDLNGNFIKYWECMADAAEFYSKNQSRDCSSISACCDWNKKNFHYTAYNYLWIAEEYNIAYEDIVKEINNRVIYLQTDYARQAAHHNTKLNKYTDNRLHTHSSHNATAIDAFDLNGDFVVSFDTCTQANNYYNTSGILSYDVIPCVRQGYIWLYPHQYDDKLHEQQRVLDIIKEIKDKKPLNKSSIYQYDKEGNLLAEYNSIAEASNKTGISRTNIGNNLSQKSKSAGGYVWKYKNKTQITYIKAKLNMYDLHHNFIKQFDSLADANKEMNIDKSTIIRCCKGKQKTAGGYIWEYDIK